MEMHFLDLFAFYSCNVDENFCISSSGGRGCDLFGEKHCILRVRHKRVVEVRRKDLMLNCMPIYVNYAIWKWIVIYLREFIMDCPEGVLTKEKVSIIIRQSICPDTKKNIFASWETKVKRTLWNWNHQVLDMLLFILPRDNGHIIADLIFTAFDK